MVMILKIKRIFKIKSTGIDSALEHQQRFIRNILLSSVPGVICCGVGTGKTITAALASQYCLSLNLEGIIIFYTPASINSQFYQFIERLWAGHSR